MTADWRPQDPERIRNWFDRIASRYDFLNSWLSFGLDDDWRRRSCEWVWEKNQKTILDLGTGTGKWIRCFLGKGRWDLAVGLDFSEAMLRHAHENQKGQVNWLSADFHQMPFSPGTFDVVISAFTLRSVSDLRCFFSGVYAVLRKDGKAAFLCLTRPRPFLGKIFYYLYVRFYLTLMGTLISGRGEAYRFLSDSVLGFQEPDQTAELMRSCGFDQVTMKRFHHGIATLIVGRKP